MQLWGDNLIGIIDAWWDRMWLRRTGWNGKEGECLLHVKAMGMHGVLPKDGQRAGHKLMGQILEGRQMKVTSWWKKKAKAHLPGVESGEGGKEQ